MEIHPLHLVAGLAFPEREEERTFGLPKKFQHGLLPSACLLKPQNFMARGREPASPVLRDPRCQWYLSLLTFLTPSVFWDLFWLQFGTPREFLVNPGQVLGPRCCLLSLLYMHDPCEWDFNSLLAERDIGPLDIVTPLIAMWANGQKQLSLAEYGANVLPFFLLNYLI